MENINYEELTGMTFHEYIEVVTKQIEIIIEERDLYFKSLNNILNGDYPNQYNTDNPQCNHNKYRWEDCERCTDDYIVSVLAKGKEISDKAPVIPTI